MRSALYAVLMPWWLIAVAGCNTLSSFGLPSYNASNRLLDSAKNIAENPQTAVDLPRELQKLPLPTYLVEIGDTISIETVSFDATIRLPGDQLVLPDGTISLGEFGSRPVAGKTIAQIQQEIQAIIRANLEFDLRNQLSESAKNQNLQPDDDSSIRDQLNRLTRANRVSVRLVNWDSKAIYILGEVNAPGSLPYSGNQTVLDAIVTAGGLASSANVHQIILARPTPNGSCRIVLLICYNEVVQLGDTSTNYQLLPGDRVFVPSMTLIGDLKSTLFPHHSAACPRCAPVQRGCF